MTETKKILCNACEEDLTYTSNSIDYCLTLKNTQIQSKGGMVYDMMIYPKINEDKHFCGLLCLRNWIKEIDPKDNL